MSEKIPCTKCGALVLPSTAERTGGLCMPCKSGNRENIERGKEYYKKQRELDKTCPYRALWKELINKVYHTEGGFNILSEEEQLYFAVTVLTGEVYNGGFDQFFTNSSGAYYCKAELGLVRLGATHSLKLLHQAKERCFGQNSVPQDREMRWELLRKNNTELELDSLDTLFYKDPDQLEQKLENFAIDVGLIKNS